MKSSESRVNSGAGGAGANQIPSLVPDAEETEGQHQQSNAAGAARLIPVAQVPVGGSPLTEEWKLRKVTFHLLAVLTALPEEYKLSATNCSTKEQKAQYTQLKNFQQKSCRVVHASEVEDKYIPQNALFVLVNKQEMGIVDSADGLHSQQVDKYFLLKKDTGAFYVPNQFIAGSFMEILNSKEHQDAFFTPETTPFTPKGVMESFKKHVIGIVAAVTTQVQEVLSAKATEVDEICNTIYARVASEKTFYDLEKQITKLSFDTPYARAKATKMLEHLQGVLGGAANPDPAGAQEHLQAEVESLSNALEALKESHATDRSLWLAETNGLGTERSEMQRRIETLETQLAEAQLELEVIRAKLESLKVSGGDNDENMDLSE